MFRNSILRRMLSGLNLNHLNCVGLELKGICLNCLPRTTCIINFSKIYLVEFVDILKSIQSIQGLLSQFIPPYTIIRYKIRDNQSNAIMYNALFDYLCIKQMYLLKQWISGSIGKKICKIKNVKNWEIVKYWRLFTLLFLFIACSFHVLLIWYPFYMGWHSKEKS